MRQLLRLVTSVIFKVFFRVETVNLERIPCEGPAILCSNHNSMIDMFFLGFKVRRWIYWMAKEELFKNPISGFIFRKLGAFPVKRGKGDVGSIKTAYKLLEEGKMVGIFPQGHRLTERNRNTFRVKPGAAMLALNSAAKVVPAAIDGSYRLFGRMRVIYGEPFAIKSENGKKYTVEELSMISEDIMKRVYSLLEASS